MPEGDSVGTVFLECVVNPRSLQKSLHGQSGMVRRQGTSLGKRFSSAFSVAAGLGIVAGFRSIGGVITDFINTAARTDVLNVAMQSVARSSGYATNALAAQKEAVMDLGIAEQEATQILTRFMQAQPDVADASKIARTAQNAAVIAGMNSSQAAEQMTEAIAKQRPELLTAFGFTRNLNDIYSDYAKTVGKGVKQLTEFDKKQAMVNYILSEGEKIAGTYEASMGVVGKQIGSLPRYHDTLKNALAEPLALPAISTVVESITQGLKNSIQWAEANTATLQRWGQTAASMASGLINAFKWVTRAIADNWTTIKFATTALLTYAVTTRAVAKATAIWSAINLALKGQLVAKIPLLSFVSTAMGIYKVQMALASAQGIVLTGVLAKVRVALYSVWTALGPIGWGVILLSGLVAGGIALWNKYTKSLQQVPKISNTMTDAIGGTTSALQGQTEAMLDAANVAQKSLMPFDEINRIGETIGPVVPDFPSIAMPEIDLPDMNWDGMMDGLEATLEDTKGTLEGFLEYYGASFLVDEWNKWWPVAEKLFTGDWEGMVEQLKSIYAPIGLYLGFKFMEAWLNVKEWWNSSKVGQFFGDTWTSIKDTFKGAPGWFSGVFSDAWTKIKEWFNPSKFRQRASDAWTGIKNTFKSIPNWFKNKFSDAWTRVKKVFSPGGDTFRGIKEGIARTFKTIVNGLIRGINTIIRTPFNSINRMLNKIRGISVFGARPFSNLWGYNPLRVPQIPMLADGGLISAPTLAMVGDNPNARVDPEVVAPLSKLQDMLTRAVQSAQGSSGDGEPLRIIVNVGNKTVADAFVDESTRKNARAGRTVIPVGVR